MSPNLRMSISLLKRLNPIGRFRLGDASRVQRTKLECACSIALWSSGHSGDVYRSKVSLRDIKAAGMNNLLYLKMGPSTGAFDSRELGILRQWHSKLVQLVDLPGLIQEWYKCSSFKCSDLCSNCFRCALISLL